MLTTERLRLRPSHFDDVPMLEAINRLSWRQVGNRLRTLDETRAIVEAQEGKAFGAPGWYEHVIERQEDGAVVGRIAINFDGPGERQAEIGYALHPDHWGQGYAREGIGRMVDHLFADMGLHRLVAITGIGNQASRRLLDRLGFRLEGETIESFFHQAEQRFVDEAVYALLAREWAAR